MCVIGWKPAAEDVEAARAKIEADKAQAQADLEAQQLAEQQKQTNEPTAMISGDSHSSHGDDAEAAPLEGNADVGEEGPAEFVAGCGSRPFIWLLEHTPPLVEDPRLLIIGHPNGDPKMLSMHGCDVRQPRQTPWSSSQKERTSFWTRTTRPRDAADRRCSTCAVRRVALHHSSQPKSLAENAIGEKVKYDYNFGTAVSSIYAALHAFALTDDCKDEWKALVHEALEDEPADDFEE